MNESKDSRLLADPNVVALNHEQATIKIVTEVPFQQLTQSALGGAIGTTEFREAGVTLDVIPHIAPDGTITMVVSPEFSVLTGFTPETNAPIIDTREATTTVRVRDRETLVLGGLRQRSRQRNGSSLAAPGRRAAGRPGCSAAGSSRCAESELLVFLTPEIVGPAYDGDCREHTRSPASPGASWRRPRSTRRRWAWGAVIAEDRARDRLPWWDRGWPRPRSPGATRRRDGGGPSARTGAVRYPGACPGCGSAACPGVGAGRPPAGRRYSSSTPA